MNLFPSCLRRLNHLLINKWKDRSTRAMGKSRKEPFGFQKPEKLKVSTVSFYHFYKIGEEPRSVSGTESLIGPEPHTLGDVSFTLIDRMETGTLELTM